MPWTEADIPDQQGRTAVVTGANSGLGFHTARALAGHGARVVLACRDARRGEEAKAAIDAETGAPERTEVEVLDLASLASIRATAAALLDRLPRLDLLIDNAGVMAIPRRETADGFELQLGTNHFGHFALAGLLLPRLLATPGARVVTVSSNAHKMGRMDFDDLDGRRRYQKWLQYGRSKLANLLFAYELDRRLRAGGHGLISAAAHPGYASTNLQLVGPRMEGSRLMERISALGNVLLGQSAAQGALPQLFAATAPGVEGGDYIGPDGPFEMRGHPRKTGSNGRSHDREAASRLWAESVRRTGVDFGGL